MDVGRLHLQYTSVSLAAPRLCLQNMETMSLQQAVATYNASRTHAECLNRMEEAILYIFYIFICFNILYRIF